MKIKKLWLEIETDGGETLLRPATEDDLEYLRYRPNPGAFQKTYIPLTNTLHLPVAESQDLGFPTWEPGPGYSREEIEALRLKPGEAVTG